MRADTRFYASAIAVVRPSAQSRPDAKTEGLDGPSVPLIELRWRRGRYLLPS